MESEAKEKPAYTILQKMDKALQEELKRFFSAS